jgi:ion channel-forming bestrophin family protein
MSDIAPKSETPDQHKARCIIEKKTVINLLEAFGVAVKHYLRGEDGIYYEDLYHLVKFLPSYALPAGLPSVGDLSDVRAFRTKSLSQRQPPSPSSPRQRVPSTSNDNPSVIPSHVQNLSTSRLPPPVSSPISATYSIRSVAEVSEPKTSHEQDNDPEKNTIRNGDEPFLSPSRMPPKYSLFDFFPFSLLVHALTKKGKNIKGKKAARARAKLNISHNLPLEISLYLVCF